MFPKALAVAFIFASSLATAVPLAKRQTFTGDGTFFVPGLGACGFENTSTQLVAALGHIDFDSFSGGNPNPNDNPVCGRQVKASSGGKSVTVEIVDRCAGCAGEFDLDFSETAFAALADPSVGRIPITWEFV
ncbi:RlpA-like double-psi beta-barrel-protein domain-containing protein-containing protein [Rhodocollybia butyracea]|uniref:RlpA-like double-psi beta-barrel-protein domain-containing protein-containing protein n=1 Tax=Rhodocollybia butyracea TaxID=206335 RepID=A0A9P5U4V8_9AGAR|nr:RlpA-like double-psi beta-barrel-protein domain-containing protein-containing protein [Rhodocollybia butyracea]